MANEYLREVSFTLVRQEYLASVLQSVVSATGEVNAQLEKRADMLRSLFSTKDVLPGNYEVGSRLKRNHFFSQASDAWCFFTKNVTEYFRCSW